MVVNTSGGVAYCEIGHLLLYRRGCCFSQWVKLVEREGGRADGWAAGRTDEEADAGSQVLGSGAELPGSGYTPAENCACATEHGACRSTMLLETSYSRPTLQPGPRNDPKRLLQASWMLDAPKAPKRNSGGFLGPLGWLGTKIL